MGIPGTQNPRMWISYLASSRNDLQTVVSTMERMSKSVNKRINFLFHKVKPCGTTQFYWLQNKNPQQTKVRTAPKSNLVKQCIFIGATNEYKGEKLFTGARMFQQKAAQLMAKKTVVWEYSAWLAGHSTHPRLSSLQLGGRLLPGVVCAFIKRGGPSGIF